MSVDVHKMPDDFNNKVELFKYERTYNYAWYIKAMCAIYAIVKGDVK